MQVVTETKERWLGRRLMADVTIAVDRANTLGEASRVVAATRDRLAGPRRHSTT